MKPIERYADLLCSDTENSWRNQVFKFGQELGYDRTLLAIFHDRNTPIEAEFAFLHSNYAPAWRNKYDEEKMGHLDPTVMHCATKSTPLVWSPGIFFEQKQKEMYEEACGYGLSSGITLPIHGAMGELGILCFTSDTKPGKLFQKHVSHTLPKLSCFRDYIFESSLRFMRPVLNKKNQIKVTKRELECLKWSANGKSSWEMGQIMNCTEATVNFHFGNILRKFNSTSRLQAVIKAIHLRIIFPS